jgi:hypothetical protein
MIIAPACRRGRGEGMETPRTAPPFAEKTPRSPFVLCAQALRVHAARFLIWWYRRKKHHQRQRAHARSLARRMSMRSVEKQVSEWVPTLSPRTNRTLHVPYPVLIGHFTSHTPYRSDTSRPSPILTTRSEQPPLPFWRCVPWLLFSPATWFNLL